MGYTAQEYMPELGVVNMNARMYDPALNRFLSPDPYVQDATNSRTFNLYNYCGNNPMMFTDPDDEIFWLIPVAIGIALGAGSGYTIGKQIMHAETTIQLPKNQ